jgi:hypothetical protein
MKILKFNTESLSSEEIETPKVHYLPCKIHYDGPAPVKSYFLMDEKKDHEESSSK